jgi:hypothetical protein
MNCRIPKVTPCVPFKSKRATLARSREKFDTGKGGSERGNPRPPALTYNIEED